MNANAIHPDNTYITHNPPVGDTGKPLPRRYYVVIPTFETMTPEERSSVEAGGPWPLRQRAFLPSHETFLDFLVDQGVEAWTSKNGGSR
jgi:hypothetical protein